MQSVEQIDQPIIKKIYFINYFLPIAVIGWMGSSIKFLNHIFTANTRWILLGIIFLFVCSRTRLFHFFDKKLAIILTVYCGWCFSTSMWSTIPFLSFMKSGIYVLTIPLLIFIGLEWARKNPDEQLLNYLSIFSFVTIVSSFFSKHSIDPHEYYMGFMTGANMLGLMLAISATYCFWKTYQYFTQKQFNLNQFYLYLFLSISCIYYVFLSMSRAAILMIFMILSGLLFSLNFNKKVNIIILAIMLSLSLITLNPSVIENVQTDAGKYIFKGQNTLFHSRNKAWSQSYQGAEEGGWTGLGFGIAYGNNEFELGGRLSAVNYGREKGNSQLAIIEEIGIIGFILYVILLSFVFIKLIILFFNSENQNQRVLTGILTGAFIGMFILSLFEAWWLSPGSPESMYFWVLIGIIRGLEMSINNKRVHYV